MSAKEPINGFHLDRLPRQHRDAVLGDERLQHPRRKAVTAAGRLQRGLYQQHALHGICAVDSASTDRIAVTAYKISTVRRGDQPSANRRW